VPTGSPGPPAGTASIAFLGVGVDGPAADASRDRVFTFTSDAAGVVEASAETGGPENVRLCLGRGAPGSVTAQQCQESTEASVTSVASAAETTWTVSLTGADGAGGTADLVLGFPSEAPSVTLDGFRFQGTAFDDYNGFLAEVRIGCCSLAMDAEWTGGSAPYRLLLSASDGGTIIDESGEGGGFAFDAQTAADSYRIRLSNQQEFAEQDFTLRATISWF
jgi:hypothetical protein